MEYELGGDRAVIIVSALVVILSSSTSVCGEDSVDPVLPGRVCCHQSIPLASLLP